MSIKCLNYKKIYIYLSPVYSYFLNISTNNYKLYRVIEFNYTFHCTFSCITLHTLYVSSSTLILEGVKSVIAQEVNNWADVLNSFTLSLKTPLLCSGRVFYSLL